MRKRRMGRDKAAWKALRHVDVLLGCLVVLRHRHTASTERRRACEEGETKENKFKKSK